MAKSVVTESSHIRNFAAALNSLLTERAWQQQHRLLASGVQPEELIRRAIADDDQAALRALKENLPHYAETRRVGAVNGTPLFSEDKTACANELPCGSELIMSGSLSGPKPLHIQRR